MKNLLSENMLRFGTKNLSEAAQRELVLKSIMETINEHGLHNAVRSRLMEQSPKPGATVPVNSPSQGSINAPVPTDSKTLGEASRIIGELIKAFEFSFSKGGTDDTAASKAIYSIKTPQIYYAVLWKLKYSTSVKAAMGYNYNLVGDFLSTDMKYAAGQRPDHEFGDAGSPTAPGAVVQSLLGTTSQYKDYERHLQQFNKNERIKTVTFSD
jgi:hypothetical protein